MVDTIYRVFVTVILSTVGISLCVFFLSFCTIKLLERNEEQGSRESSSSPNARAPDVSEHQHDEETGVSLAEMQEIQAQLDRKALIRSKLHYQIVLPEKNNVTIESLRQANPKDATMNDNTEVEKEEAIMTDINLDDDDDDNSTIASDHGTKQESASSSLYHRVWDLFSLRSLRPRKEDVCSICLEGFQAGQTICAAKNACCHHTFHLECIRTWLMENDDCCNCRRKIIE